MTAFRGRIRLPRSLHPMYPLLPLLGVLAAHAGCSDGAPSLVATPTEVMTEYGPVRGSIGNGAVGYLGIPAAAPPTGSLRFAPPAAPTPWTDTLDADTPPARARR
ncbi:MAG: carboxylesterase family protein [Sandaracinaceae bacterium]|nr:carboxylesterase family protein [Sandaracinaceae bacterium]